MMEITVRGRQNHVPEALREFATEKAQHLGKYLSTITSVDVEFSRDGKPKSETGGYLVHVTVATSGPVFRAKAISPDAHAAVDLAVERLSRRLKEFKRRRSGRPLHSRPKVQPADMKGTEADMSGRSAPAEPAGPEPGELDEGPAD